MPASTGISHDHNAVRVVARGRTLAEVQQDALRIAADFFGVPAHAATLTITPATAVPVVVDHEGVVKLYKATMTVRYAAGPGAVLPPGPARLDEDEDDDDDVDELAEDDGEEDFT